MAIMAAVAQLSYDHLLEGRMHQKVISQVLAKAFPEVQESTTAPHLRRQSYMNK